MELYTTASDSDIDSDEGENIKLHSWLIFREKIMIALQIIDALRYMHDCGFINRDIKPSNTGLINSLDRYRPTTVKLFDFGFCRELPSANDDDNDKKHNINEDHRDECYHMSHVG